MDVNLLNPEEIGSVKSESLMLLVPEAIYNQFRENFNEIKSENVFGAVFPGVIFNGRRYDDKIIAVEFDFEVKVYRGVVDRVEGKTLMIFGDALHADIESLIEKIYFKLGNRIKYIGGGAGSMRSRIKCLFDRAGFFSESILLAFLPHDFNIAVRHGWRELDQSFISTEVDGRRIIELDWKPAFEVYREALELSGVQISRKNFFEVALAFPFGLSKVKGEDIIRDPIGLDGDSIICAGNVPQNCILKLMHGDKEDLIKATRDCLESVENAVLSFDCISRAIFLGEDLDRELRYLKDTFGALTIGEIGCDDGFLEFHNKTVVVGGLG
ncbi:FIST signal transduction protein [Archaeoglobus neptunius]|uniref:FIST signal transduction protein n=1 Tax=Archaeoglobus neptunius TaxID=2798580 RepID=UPI0019280020|nr:FIST C-terminal domain-containing protein [Archaeoglobus neptunius]